MAWDHLSITKSHLVYIILGGFTSLFMLCSSVIKERMYIGEATVATICGLIFGPHAANLIDPQSWGNVDEVTLEFSRIVLVVQCFAVGVELPKFYMEKHWRSVTLLLIPVMTFGWLVTSLFIFWMIPSLNWLESLTVAACVTATDPVLASSVVGKGKFAKRVPKHLRDLLSAESGCNDGMAFPFVYLALYLIQENLKAKETVFHWIVYTILYECIFGAIYGFAVGYIARHGIKLAEKHELIDRESFLVFYFVLALFCAGSGSILGVDDLLVGFAAGVGFSNDGWFASKTEESHVSNVIDLLLNLAYFVFLGTIIPWEQFNNAELGLSAWRLTVIAIFVILFRRIPIMLALKPLIPDIKTWREALFAGHFGPIGVGAIFVAILARAELETEHTIPLAELPPPGTEHYTLIALVWPIVTFMVISSIIVHGSSVAVFTLGKRINTLSLTMSYTVATEDGPSWMNRLPRISSVSRSQARTMSDTDMDDLKMPDFPPGTLPPTGVPGQFLRRQREEESGKGSSRASSLASRRRRKVWDDGIGPGGPITQSAIFPQRRSQSGNLLEPISPSQADGRVRTERRRTSGSLRDDRSSSRGRRAEKDRGHDPEKTEQPTPEEDAAPKDEPTPDQPRVQVYDEGDNLIIEDAEGQVLDVEPTNRHLSPDVGRLQDKLRSETQKPGGWTYESMKKRFDEWRDEEARKRKAKARADRKHEPARAYQIGSTIIVEDEDGEVVKQYDLPADSGTTEAGPSGSGQKHSFGGWAGFNRSGGAEARKKNVADVPEEESEDDDRKIRFTIAGEGRRMNKDDFLKEVMKLDAKSRHEALEQPGVTEAMKSSARQQAQAGSSSQAAKDKAQPTTEHASSSTTRAESNSPDRPQKSSEAPKVTRGRSGTTTSVAAHSVAGSDGLSTETPETDVEKRRRLAALSSIQSDSEHETPAERRRREAALGVGGVGREDSDSDDDDTPRVPSARRGIRFADVPPKTRDA